MVGVDGDTLNFCAGLGFFGNLAFRFDFNC